MSFCSFGENYAMFDSTPIENIFLQEYMLRAPGNYVKAYLYGLMLCYHPAEAMSLTRMAHDMGMEEDEVFQAFQYWEREGLVRRVADNPVSYAFRSIRHTMLTGEHAKEDLYKYKEFNQRLHAVCADKRKLYKQDYQRIYEWIEVLRLPEDVVLELIQSQLAQRSRFSFEKAEQIARDWAQRGIATAAEAKELARHDKQQEADLKQVLRRLGQRREPSMDELALYEKWTHDWGFSLPAILAACAETTKGAPTMAYLGGILERQHKLGKHDARAIEGQLSAERDAAEPVKAIYRALGRRGVSPTAEDMALVTSWLGAGASPELMELAAQVAHHNGGNSLDAVAQRLDAWRQKGLTTREQVDGYLTVVRRDNAQLTEIYEACGATQRPNAADRALLTTWRDAWKMPSDVILLAAGYGAHAQVKMPFIDKILSSWNDQAIRTIAAAQDERARHGAPAQTAADKPARPAKEVAQHRYAQRDYAPDDLEALFFDVKVYDRKGGGAT